MVTSLARILVWFLAVTATVACSIGHANARIAYWTEETRVHVPVGSRIEDAQAFFASRGLQLRCCMSGPDIDRAYSAMERKIGRFVWIEYSALIVVDVSPDHQVSRVRVLRVGVGP
jgi:hypothetical protein